MAKWRPLHQNITKSDKMLTLALEGDLFAMNLYQNLLPYTDRAGRLNAHPLALLGSVFEGYPFTAEQIEAALHALNRVGLIVLYRTARQQYLVEYTNFEALNVFDKREVKSQLPGPTDDGCEIVPVSPAPVTLAPAPTTDAPKAITDNPMGTPGDTLESPRTHVHVHLQEHVQEHEHVLAISTSERPALVPVGQARRALAKPSKQRRSQNLSDLAPPLLEMVEVWNEHCGPLPKVDRVGDDRLRKLQRCLDEYGEDAVNRLRDATKEVARDEFYLRKGYGLDILLAGDKVLERSDRWRQSGGMSEADRRLAAKAAKVAEAIGGLN